MAHPNTFEVMELFKTEQVNTEVLLVQLAAGGGSEKHKEEVPHKTEETCENRRKVRKGGEGLYTIEEYIDGISKWMGFCM